VEITEVRIKLMDDGSDRLKAFCSITFDDCFVIRDLKIIDGTNGPFVAMPSRKLTAHCPECGCKNHLRAGYCNQCGHRQREDQAIKDDDGRAKLYADIAHPINSECREMIQARVIEEFELELDRAQEPDYTSRYDEFDYDAAEPHFERQPGKSNSRNTTNDSKPRVESQEQPKKRAPFTGKKRVSESQSRPPATDSFGEGIF
jgi:stage V sporulation protein G